MTWLDLRDAMHAALRRGNVESARRLHVALCRLEAEQSARKKVRR